MKIVIAADHRGYELKDKLLPFLRSAGALDPPPEILDLGTHSEDPVDYPDYAEAVGEAILEGQADRGILICGSGVGVTVAANKLPGIRACLCHDLYSAHQGVEHDDMNVLVLGSLVVDEDIARELIHAFLAARFDSVPRHVRRLHKIREIEVHSCEHQYDYDNDQKKEVS